MSTTLSGLGTKQKSQRRLPVLPILSGIMLIAAIGIFVVELLTFSQQEGRLSAGISVGGIPVGGLSPGQAVSEWEQAFAQPVILYYNDSPIVLDPASVGFRTNQENMLAQAQSAGGSEIGFWRRFYNHLMRQEEESIINVPLSAEYQENLLEQFLQDIAARYDRPPGDAGFNLQTLTIRPGAEGYVLDTEAALPLVDAALRDPQNRTVSLPLKGADALSGDITTLRDLIVAYLDSEGFIYDSQTSVASVFILDLQTGEEINLNGDVAVTAASVSKIGIMIDYFRNLPIAPTPEEAWLMANSLLCSNNSSSNLIMQIIGQNDLFAGLADITNTLQFLGARNSYITAPFDLGVEGQQLGSIPAPQTSPNPNFNTRPDPFNQTTAEDIGVLLNLIYDCANYGSGLMAAYPNGEFTQTECRQMLELMSANDLLRLLQGGLPAGTRISHKNGWVADTHGDGGIVFSPSGRHYIIVVFLWEDTEFLDYSRGWPLIEGISRATWNYFNPETPLLAAREDLPVTAQECVGNFLPPSPEQTDLNNINGWRTQPVQQSPLVPTPLPETTTLQ
jgi:beta-lactamase class A